MKILGVDSSLNHWGAAVVDVNIDTATLTLERYDQYEYDGGLELQHKLYKIYNDFVDLIDTINPDEVVFEDQHFSRNIDTLKKLCQSVGVMKLATCLFDPEMPIVVLTPTQIKQALTGNGRAEKEQMITAVLNLFDVSVTEDEADSIGICIARAFSDVWKYYPVVVNFGSKSDITLAKFMSTRPKRVSNDNKRELYGILKTLFKFKVSDELKKEQN